MAQAYALQLDVSGQLETLERSGTWGFRHGPGFRQVIFRHLHLIFPINCVITFVIQFCKIG